MTVQQGSGSFQASPTHQNYIGSLLDRKVDSIEKDGELVGFSLDEQDVRLRRDGVSPLDGKRGLKRPDLLRSRIRTGCDLFD